jgi:hypothetical protein
MSLERLRYNFHGFNPSLTLPTNHGKKKNEKLLKFDSLSMGFPAFRVVETGCRNTQSIAATVRFHQMES